MTVLLFNPRNFEYHCEYCNCPKDLWKRDLKTFAPEDETVECQLMSEVFGIILDLEFKEKAFTLKDIAERIKSDPEAQYPESVFNFTIAEIVDIYCEEGYMPDNYCPSKPQIKEA